MGLDKRLLESFTKITSAEGEICPVCTDKIDPEKNVYVVIKCGHALCSPCAGKLVQSGNADIPNNKRCPTCRNDNALQNDTNVYICRIDLDDWELEHDVVTASVLKDHPKCPFDAVDQTTQTDLDKVYDELPNVPRKKRPHDPVDPRMKLKLDVLRRTASVLRDDVDKMVKRQKTETEDIAKYEKEIVGLQAKVTVAKKNLDTYCQHTNFLVTRLDSVNKEITGITMAAVDKAIDTRTSEEANRD